MHDCFLVHLYICSCVIEKEFCFSLFVGMANHNFGQSTNYSRRDSVRAKIWQ